MVKRKRGKLRAIGEVYNVRERMTEEAGVHGSWDDYPDWYEYEMFLYGPNGEIVDEWDSLSETYNGVQRLSRETAERAVKEIVDDVAAGKVEHWFSHVPKTLLTSSTGTGKRLKRSTKTSALRPRPAGVRGLRW